MKQRSKLVLILFLMSGFSGLQLAVAQQAENQAAPVLLLWPEGAPLTRGEQDADKPALTLFLASKETNTAAAVVVCPGGGYQALAMDHEGVQVARWLNSFGVNAFVLKYRIGKWDGSG